MITEFQFSSLFAHVWSKGMTINNIIPFAPKVILDKFPKPKNSNALLEGSNSISTEKTNDKADITSTSTYVGHR